jgi:hypothetical protein
VSSENSHKDQPQADYEAAAQVTRELGLRAAELLVAHAVEPDLIIIPRRRVRVAPDGLFSNIDNHEPRINFEWFIPWGRYQNEDGQPIRAWEVEGEIIGTTDQRPPMPLELNEDGVYDVQRKLFVVEGRGLRHTMLAGRLSRPEPHIDTTGLLGTLYKDDEADVSIAAALSRHWADAGYISQSVFDTAEHEGWLQGEIVDFAGSHGIHLPEAP